MAKRFSHQMSKKFHNFKSFAISTFVAVEETPSVNFSFNVCLPTVFKVAALSTLMIWIFGWKFKQINLLVMLRVSNKPAPGHPKAYRAQPRPAPISKTSGACLGVPRAEPRVWFYWSQEWPALPSQEPSGPAPGHPEVYRVNSDLKRGGKRKKYG